MKQVVEDVRSGAIAVPEVAAPMCRPGSVLVHTRASLISAGTEAAALQFGKQSMLEKARSRPDLVKQVVNKVRTDGLMATYQAVQARLDVPLALGYSCAGRVLELGAGVTGLREGDLVACAGMGYASHAEIVAVPKNLVVRAPEGVQPEEAAFSTVGAIALQGLRIADVRVGEKVVVIGLGLVGLLTVQLLRAAGCRVLGTDLNPARVELAKQLGANEALTLDEHAVLEAVTAFTDGRGADAVLVTAATKSSGPVELAGEVSRLRGRVVAVGDVGMDVPRRTYYEKELELRVSRSYGPGRYDPVYEEKGIDYPYAYVPFTEQRNMETFLQLVAERKVTPNRLITHQFSVDEAGAAYALIKGETKEPFLGVVFGYSDSPNLNRRIAVAAPSAAPARESAVRVGMLGAGAYARVQLLPKLKALPEAELVGVSTARGVSGLDAAKRFGFAYATTDNAEVLADPRVNLVVIATRHDSHARLAEAALRAGKHVFVEKPLATNEADLRALVAAAEETGRHVMVGFNRRFAPLVQQGRVRFAGRSQPLSMVYRVNAGAVPGEHWTKDADEGGGRIVGEVCHFVDLLQYLCGAPPVAVYATSLAGGGAAGPVAEDVVSIQLRFADGSIGAIHYFANGDKSVPKEYLEVYGGGRTFILDDFRSARVGEGGKLTPLKAAGQDKGQAGELRALADALRSGGPTPIPLADSVATTLATFRILDSLRSGRETLVEWTSE